MFLMGYSIRKVLRYGFTLIDHDMKLEQEHVVVWKTACKRSCHVWVSLSYIYQLSGAQWRRVISSLSSYPARLPRHSDLHTASWAVSDSKLE